MNTIDKLMWFVLFMLITIAFPAAVLCLAVPTTITSYSLFSIYVGFMVYNIGSLTIWSK